jgi:hypothetical protein
MLTHAIIVFIIMLLLGGAARAAVGKGVLSRWAIYPLASLLAASVSFGLTIPTALIAVASAITIGFGRTDWYNKNYMAVRYSLLPVVATFFSVTLFAVTPYLFIWPLLSAVVGYFYGDMKNYVASKGWSDHIPEAIAGSVIIGLTSIGLFF